MPMLPDGLRARDDASPPATETVSRHRSVEGSIFDMHRTMARRGVQRLSSGPGRAGEHFDDHARQVARELLRER
jgi:hypothetical protein